MALTIQCLPYLGCKLQMLNCANDRNTGNRKRGCNLTGKSKYVVFGLVSILTHCEEYGDLWFNKHTCMRCSRDLR